MLRQSVCCTARHGQADNACCADFAGKCTTVTWSVELFSTQVHMHRHTCIHMHYIHYMQTTYEVSVYQCCDCLLPAPQVIKGDGPSLTVLSETQELGNLYLDSSRYLSADTLTKAVLSLPVVEHRNNTKNSILFFFFWINISNPVKKHNLISCSFP